MTAVTGWSDDQGTLARAVSVNGHGLHTGRKVRLQIDPAPLGHGIVFRRMRGTTLLGELKAEPGLRLAQPLCTALQTPEGLRVRTTEHLLAALLACEIDHALVTLDAEEVPILDGSALPWIQLLQDAGRQAFAVPKRFVKILQPLRVGDGDNRYTSIAPHDSYQLQVRNDLKGFGQMCWEGDLTPTSFARDIAPSRSYGRLKWAIPAIAGGFLKGVPILRGARPSCTATIIGGSVHGGMRLPAEFVRHRVLDMVGDLALLGAPLLGRIEAHRPSHEMNYQLAAALLKQPESWCWV